MTGWPTVRQSTGWSAGWLVGWLVSWLAGQPAGWLAGSSLYVAIDPEDAEVVTLLLSLAHVADVGVEHEMEAEGVDEGDCGG